MRGIKGLRIAAAAVVAVGTMANLGLGAGASVKPRYVSKTTRVARGLTLTRMKDRQAPNRIRILRVDVSTKLTLDLGLGTDIIPGRERTGSIARRRGAIAAINGSFGSLGRPSGVYAEDGDIKTTAVADSAAFALARNERTAYVGWPKARVTATNPMTGSMWQVGDWNEEYPAPEGLAGYTKAGGRRISPPPDACAVGLVPTSPLVWDPSRLGVGRDYVIDEARCSPEPLPVEKGIVIAARQDSASAAELALAVPGDTMHLSWSTGWPGVLDVVNGNPVLIKDGIVVAEPCDGYECARQPRTGIGVTATGEVLLVTVDGRQDSSIGLAIVPFAKLMKRLGAVTALNLDGGGSTTMVVRGELVNRPSEGVQRKITSAVLVLPGRDLNEPRPLDP